VRPWIRNGGTTLMTVACLLSASRPVEAQQADSLRQAQADSARLHMMERLKRLGRPPGFDTTLFIQDSLAEVARREHRGGGAVAARDTTLRELLQMRGYGVTEYEGGQADFSAKDRVLVLESSKDQQAHVNRDGNDVKADTSITYSETSGRIRTVGQSTFAPAGSDEVQAKGLVYDLHLGKGSALDAKTTYDQDGAKWIVSGDMPLAAPDSQYMSHAIFTSCDLAVPHYHFETDEIKIIAGKVLIARPVRLYFSDVPVAWLPFIANSLSKGRASGILTPQFSVNDIVRTSGGYRRRISNLGFYWAMSDYSDATIALDWWSDNYTALTSSLQYRWNRQFLNGGINFRRFWQAGGGVQDALDTQHSWQIDERTSVRLSARYASSAAFVRQNSLNPQEVTQSIDSQGGVNRRFDWGNLSLSASRQQYLNDDRTSWMLPSANLSLSTITLFKAPESEAHFWNNMTWSGSGRMQRNTLNRVQPDTFAAGTEDTQNTTASMSSSLSMGALSLRQSVDLNRSTSLGVPTAYLEYGDSANPDSLLVGAPARSVTDQKLAWSASIDYQQRLIGSTTLTPSLSLSSNLFQSDTSTYAGKFVSAPMRMSFGASLKTDLYRFFPGFGPYQAIRHKVSPSFTFAWSPGSQPTQLQTLVFRGTQAIGATKTLGITLNQTFEAKKKQESTDSTSADSTGASAPAAVAGTGPGSNEPRRAQQKAEIVQLLGISTSVVTYDFIRADTSSFIQGFTTTQLHNQISSDFLRGLSLSINHDLFDDQVDENGVRQRKFSPHLSQVNFNFALSSSSGIFRLLGLSGKGDQGASRQTEESDTTVENSFATAVTDASSIIPGAAGPAAQDLGGRRSGARGQGWQANLSYALQRPRAKSAQSSQMLSGTISLHPTEFWDVSWRTSFDLQAGKFNDQTISLTRDLHRWEAHFLFTQPATGNWQFRFEVSLTDQRDLKFDYSQRSAGAGRAVTPKTAR
jgi:lipopolysaccharide assembly outer membrane protein LptD (OstA)